MKKIFLILFIACATLLQAASVEATLSSPEVVEGNMVQLRIKATGNRAAFPDIKQIGDAKVLGKSQQQHNSISYINGKMNNEHSTTLVLTFAPEHDMTIPSFTVNVDGKALKTKPLSLKVVKSDATLPGAKGANSKPFSLSMKANKSEVIVGEPVLLTVYFAVRDGVQIQDTEYAPPSFDGFFAKLIKDQKVYRKSGYQIQEIRTILIPQKEGVFKIGPAVAKIGVADRSRRDMFGMFFGTKWSQIVSNSVTIRVAAAPADADLVGKFSADAILNKAVTKANKPVNLTVTIEGEGNLEDFEMDDYEIDGVTVYSDEPVITTQVRGDKLLSRYRKRFVFISDRDFTIPPREYTVLDPETKEVKRLQIEGFDVKVENVQGVAGSASQENGAKSPMVHTNIPVNQAPETKEKIVTKKVEKVSWWMLLLVFVSGALLMWILMRLPWKKWLSKEYLVGEEEALKILYPHMGEDPAVEEMVRKLYAKKRGDKSVMIDKKALKEMLARFR